ncbi:MAG TPA: ABC transporter ATP-binding protein [Bacteroidales bacterium]|nr:ABC transporter ATP-binding protein [Bacteroidales bacterium]
MSTEAINNKRHSGHAVTLKDLQIGYQTRNSRKVVLGPVNAEIAHAEMVGIVGRNGIGKSTLLRSVAGIHNLISGEITVNGRSLHELSLRNRAKIMSYVSTDPVQAFQIRVHELIAMGRIPYTGWFGKMSPEDSEAVQNAVRLTGLEKFLKKSVHELSDGERQKVMIARALAQDTPVIILDEPTAFLDVPSRYEILRILSDLSVKNGKTILFSTHDLSLAMDIADKIWLLAENTIFQGAPEDLLISNVFRKLFLNSPAEFDTKTSSFRFRKEPTKEMVLQGHSKYRTLTKKALERAGFHCSDEEGSVMIRMEEHDGKPVWCLQRIAGEAIEFYSIYDLVGFLKFST